MQTSRPAPRRSWLRDPRLAAAALLLVVLPWLSSCSAVGYYSQAAWGQARILAQRRPIESLMADPRTPEALRRQLAAVERIREHAAGELGLPSGGSYRSFVQLPPERDGTPRRAVVWNVVAAPELDTAPLVWCFPVAGCVSYRGYFSEARARRFAGRLERKGYDVDVAGAVAYSTLGWFRDPVLSTVIDWPEADLAGLIFHELAHRLIYVKDDSRFNESFATAVEIEGVRRYLAAAGRAPEAMASYLERKRRQEELAALVLATRDALQAVYDADAPPDAKRRRKQELFAELEAATRGDADPWAGRALNNAVLASFATYHDLVPAFEALLARHGGDLEAFYAAVRRLAELPPEERERELGAPERRAPGAPG